MKASRHDGLKKMRGRKGETENGRDQETYFWAIRDLDEPSFRVTPDLYANQPTGHCHSENRAPGLQNVPDDHRYCESRWPGAKESRPPTNATLRPSSSCRIGFLTAQLHCASASKTGCEPP
jgi:hypothetical protein